MRVVQMFFSWRRPFGGLRRLSLLMSALLFAGPAGATTLEAAMDDARDIAMTTGQSLAVLAGRIADGDIVAIKGAAFGGIGLVAFVGFWLLVLRAPRDEGVIIATDESKGPLILHAIGHAPAQPAPMPLARPGTERPTRLLEAVAAARAQYEIATAERQGRPTV